MFYRNYFSVVAGLAGDTGANTLFDRQLAVSRIGSATAGRDIDCSNDILSANDTRIK